MKNKKIYYILFALAIFTIMLFLNKTDVYASAPEDFYVRTTIERWSEHNDLVYKKTDNWSGSWYTKKVYLSTAISGNPTAEGETYFELKEEDFDENDKYILKGINNFQNGNTVYLVEKYHITDSSVINEEAILAGTSNVDFASTDILDLNFEYGNGGIADTIQEKTMEHYNPCDSYRICATADNEQIPPTINYSLVGIEAGVETNIKNKGIVNLPVFGVKADFTASGNVVPAGYFSFLRANGNSVSTITGNNATPNSGYGYINGYIIKANNYSLYDYGQMTSNTSYTEFDINTIKYSWAAQAATSGGQVTNDSIDYDIGDLTQDTNLANTYYVEISGSYEKDQSVPNGVFYNILPFIIAIGVAIVGMALLKKNSIKD